jgi:hypothetical protein
VSQDEDYGIWMESETIGQPEWPLWVFGGVPVAAFIVLAVLYIAGVFT